jgi:acyl-CoA synthetase (AMP-forming)/AMP-acid ligase II
MDQAHIYSIIERWVARAPKKVALSYNDSHWTWADLDRRIRAAASALRNTGVGPGDRIAVLDKNHPACLELTLACSLVGAANAVVNFRLAPEEIEYTLADSSAKVIVAGPEFAGIVSEAWDRLDNAETLIVLGGKEDQYEQWISDVDPSAEYGHQDVDAAFVQLYTSGTTGHPKGAMLTHRGMAAQATNFALYGEMDEATVSTVAMPLFHVGGTSWSLEVMYAGGRCIIVRELVPDELLDLMEAEQVTHTFLVPAAIPPLLEDADRARRAMASLSMLCYGGSPMPLPLVRKCLETLPNECLYQVYGMTEMSGAVSSLPPTDHRRSSRQELLTSVGKILPGIEMRVVDPESNEDLPQGEIGEFWFRSEQRMSGYWRKPEATRETITPDGWLRSGDAGVVDSEGYLYLQDRVKDMIISGGENVYPAEIERVLVEHPDIAEVAVIGVPHDRWGETPKAIVVPKPGSTTASDEIIEYTQQRLARFKCPSSIELVAELPRNATGKVLKRELRVDFSP